MTAETRPLLILGTHMLALEMADLISEMEGWHVEGFVENLDRERCSAAIEGLPVYWIDDIGRFAGTHHAICGISTTHRTGFIEQASARGMSFATLVHPMARVSRKSRLGEGTFVSAGVIVASYTTLGRHVFVNRGALIGHHTAIGDHVTIQPGANVAGACRLGDRTYIGMGRGFIFQFPEQAVESGFADVIDNFGQVHQVLGGALGQGWGDSHKEPGGEAQKNRNQEEFTEP